MSNTVATSLIELLGSSELQQISSQLNADEGTTRNAVNAAVPLLISALGKNAATPDGAQALLSALSRDHDGSVLDNVAGAIGSPALQQDGAAILGHVLGGRQGTIEQGLSQAAGLDANATGTLLKVLAPMVMGSLGKQQRNQGLDAAGLAQMLLGERDVAQAGLGGLAGLLDMDGDGDVTDDLVNMGSKLIGGLFR